MQARLRFSASLARRAPPSKPKGRFSRWSSGSSTTGMLDENTDRPGTGRRAPIHGNDRRLLRRAAVEVISDAGGPFVISEWPMFASPKRAFVSTNAFPVGFKDELKSIRLMYWCRKCLSEKVFWHCEGEALDSCAAYPECVSVSGCNAIPGCRSTTPRIALIPTERDGEDFSCRSPNGATFYDPDRGRFACDMRAGGRAGARPPANFCDPCGVNTADTCRIEREVSTIFQTYVSIERFPTPP